MKTLRNRLLVGDSSAVYHVISRTACQAFLFESSEKEMFTRMLFHQARFAGIEVLNYCIMSNHIHLMIKVSPVETLPDEILLKRYEDYYGVSKVPQSTYSLDELRGILATGGEVAEVARKRILSRMGDLPAFMRELKQRFTIWYNHKHKNQGTIWASRYKSLIVEDAPETLTKVAAYIDLNPVRAEIVSDPKDYRWCGYAAAMAGRKLEREGIKQLFCGLRDYSECIQSYRLILFGKGYFTKGSTDKDLGTISAESLEEIIRLNGKIPPEMLLRLRVRYFADGAVLGSREFVDTLFRKNREQFGTKRTKGGTPLPTGLWGDLHVLRNLKRRIYG
jgi:REP element-mobilizing transposase RayT